ncbi:MAG TPA: DNA topoisomerase IV subunit A [Polyangiaceae bacterium]|nr:DNA topoisomerase IV subunit A [Polyangiaceae bacterium]
MSKRRSKGEPPSTSKKAAKGGGKRGTKRGDDGKQGDLFQKSSASKTNEEHASLHELVEARYLNYALSVITSRALPDVRDGLKPVQRRILYTMWQQHLTADTKHRKCAKVVGDVMGNYHPHGDSSIYDALVRLAQSYSLRMPLIDGQGNFGSLDGDPPAAMRYTECRLTSIAEEILGELSQDTVHFRPSYDGTKSEPVVLPAKLPHLLVNGATGIAVGMATSIPPHNPEEVCQASIRLLDALQSGKELSARELSRTIKGPDFPTGGQIVSSSQEIKSVYETGQGTIKVRSTWEKGPVTRTGQTIFITSVPYMVNKATLVEQIAEVVLSRKMPLITDVRDVSTDDVRIQIEIKKDAEEQKVLAYLFKHTQLQVGVNVNLTCLVPTENPEVGRPERLDLSTMLWHFLQFRLDVVTRRLQHELNELNRRLHILEGFAVIFPVLDKIIALIRASDGKADAAQKIMAKYKLSDEQTDAILELKLYRLAKLEIYAIEEELAGKRKRAKEISKLLGEKSGTGRWAIVRSELEGLLAGELKGTKRRTTIEEVDDEPQFSEEELIVAEDNHLLITVDGWVKRQKEIKEPAATRLREGDKVLACVAGSTRATVAFFSSFGTVYTARLIDIPATTGYGEPIQKLFKLKDGEKIIGAVSLDPRVTGDVSEKEGEIPATCGFAAASDGYAACFGVSAFVEPSTRSGRRFMRLKEGNTVVSAQLIRGGEKVIAASTEGRALVTKVDEVNYLSGPGRGVVLMKIGEGERLLAAKVATGNDDTLRVRTSMGGEQKISADRYETTSRGGKGKEVIKRGSFAEVLVDDIDAPAPFDGATAGPESKPAKKTSK